MTFTKNTGFAAFKSYISYLDLFINDQNNHPVTLEKLERHLVSGIRVRLEKSHGKGIKTNTKIRNLYVQLKPYLEFYNPESEIKLLPMQVGDFSEYKVVATRNIPVNKVLKNLFLVNNSKSKLDGQSPNLFNGKWLTLDGPGYFLNHHCISPNLAFPFKRSYLTFGTIKMETFIPHTTRRIRNGDDLLINYGTVFDFGSQGCWCCLNS